MLISRSRLFALLAHSLAVVTPSPSIAGDWLPIPSWWNENLELSGTVECFGNIFGGDYFDSKAIEISRDCFNGDENGDLVFRIYGDIHQFIYSYPGWLPEQSRVEVYPKEVVDGAKRRRLDSSGIERCVADIEYRYKTYGGEHIDVNCFVQILFEWDNQKTNRSMGLAFNGEVTFQIRHNETQHALVEGDMYEYDVPLEKAPSRDRTAEVVSRFMQNRATNLLGSQPDLTALVRRGRSTTRDITYTDGVGSFDFKFGEAGPLWADLTGSWGENDGASAHYNFAAIGGHAHIGENAVLGAMLQVDYSKLEDPELPADGRGWLVGPYVVYRHPEVPVYFEGRLLYGRTDNDVRDASFETERWLAKLKVSGEIAKGKTTWMPLIEAAYTEDYHSGFVSEFGNDIDAQFISLGEMALGLSLEHRLNDSNSLSGEVEMIASRQVADTGIDFLDQDSSAQRGRLRAGWIHGGTTGLTFEVSGFLDGIGRQDFQAQGATVQMSYNF